MSYINNVLVTVFAFQFFGLHVAALAALYNIPYYIGNMTKSTLTDASKKLRIVLSYCKILNLKSTLNGCCPIRRKVLSDSIKNQRSWKKKKVKKEKNV